MDINKIMQRNPPILTDVLDLHVHELFVIVNIRVATVNMRHRQQHEPVQVTVDDVHLNPNMPCRVSEDNDIVGRTGVPGRGWGVGEGGSGWGGEVDQEGGVNHGHGVTPSLLPLHYRHVVRGAFVVTLRNRW